MSQEINPKEDLSVVIDNIVSGSLIQIKKEILKTKTKQESRLELECLECKIVYYGKKLPRRCQYCYGEMKPYKFKDWQREAMENFFERYKGSCIWLRR